MLVPRQQYSRELKIATMREPQFRPPSSLLIWFDKVYKRKNLEREKVKENRGSAGVDGQNLEDFEAQLALQLDRLHPSG